MADQEVLDLPPATTPLTGAELFHLVQGGNSRQASVGDVNQDAIEVPYDNTSSGLTSSNVQDAIDELALTGGGGGGATTIELGFYTGGGAFVANEEVFSFIVVTPFTLPSALAGSRFIAGDAATATVVFNLKKNGTNFGTATWAAAGTIATLVAASATSFTSNDILSVTAAATPDSTLARITAAIVGAL